MPVDVEVVEVKPVYPYQVIAAEEAAKKAAAAQAIASQNAPRPDGSGISKSALSAHSEPEVKVSALSLKSIRAKRELEQTQKAIAKDVAVLPTETFNETDMLLQWNKYAQRLADKGQKIMESYLLLNDPKLEGTKIIHELPNEGSKIDFESEKHNLLGYLRGKLHNHDITIEVVVNESIENRKAFTNQDRFNRLNEINPGLDLLRRTFDLDF
ncbi:MAG TPA: DNA polymerase III subunit gamma/tau [Flavobacterium sp.]